MVINKYLFFIGPNRKAKKNCEKPFEKEADNGIGAYSLRDLGFEWHQLAQRQHTALVTLIFTFLVHRPTVPLLFC